MTPIRGYVFDAYGTLFDVHSVVEAGREITSDPVSLSATWRQKQLEYTWLRALMGRYEDFWAVTEAALRYAIRRLGLTASERTCHWRASPTRGPRSSVSRGGRARSSRTALPGCSRPPSVRAASAATSST